MQYILTSHLCIPEGNVFVFDVYLSPYMLIRNKQIFFYVLFPVLLSSEHFLDEQDYALRKNILFVFRNITKQLFCFSFSLSILLNPL